MVTHYIPFFLTSDFVFVLCSAFLSPELFFFEPIFVQALPVFFLSVPREALLILLTARLSFFFFFF